MKRNEMKNKNAKNLEMLKKFTPLNILFITQFACSSVEFIHV